MKKMILLGILAFFYVSAISQVKINFIGFHCNTETGEVSGSDEICFTIGVFRDGQYLYTKKYPASGYQGGVDKGGTYLKGEDVLYEGAPGDIKLEILFFEIDDDNPEDKLRDYDMVQRTLFRGANPQQATNALHAEFAARAQNNITSIGNITYIRKSYLLNQAVNITGTLTGDRNIDDLPYHFSMSSTRKGNNMPLLVSGIGSYTAFFRVAHANPAVRDPAIRLKWAENASIVGNSVGAVQDLGLLGGSLLQLEHGRIYQSRSGTFLLQGDILGYYVEKNGEISFGLPVSDEEVINDSKKGKLASWNEAGYTRVSRFRQGVIVWGPQRKAVYHSMDKYLTGPMLDTKVNVSALSSQQQVVTEENSSSKPPVKRKPAVKTPAASPALNPQPLPPTPRRVSVKSNG